MLENVKVFQQKYRFLNFFIYLSPRFEILAKIRILGDFIYSKCEKFQIVSRINFGTYGVFNTRMHLTDHNIFRGLHLNNWKKFKLCPTTWNFFPSQAGNPFFGQWEFQYYWCVSWKDMIFLRQNRIWRKSTIGASDWKHWQISGFWAIFSTENSFLGL